MKTFPGSKKKPSRLLLLLSGCGVVVMMFIGFFVVGAIELGLMTATETARPTIPLLDRRQTDQHVPMDQIKSEVQFDESNLAASVKPPTAPDDPEEALAELEARRKAEDIASRPRAKVFPAPSARKSTANADRLSDSKPLVMSPNLTRAPAPTGDYSASSNNSSAPKTEWVNGYTKKNGTHVNGYYRSKR